jgi:hypothetical protein
MTESIDIPMECDSTIADADHGSRSRRLDRLSLILAVLTVVIVGWTAWLRFGPGRPPGSLIIGSALPPVRLLDLETGEAKVLFGLKGKVTWVVFWSVASPSGQTVLPRLESAWKRLGQHRSFTLVAAATDSGQPDRVRAALAQTHATLPVYLATTEAVNRFGARATGPPLHYLIDADGRIAAMARGDGLDTIRRLEAQARSWLEKLDPLGGTRFALAAQEAL